MPSTARSDLDEWLLSRRWAVLACLSQTLTKGQVQMIVALIWAGIITAQALLWWEFAWTLASVRLSMLHIPALAVA